MVPKHKKPVGWYNYRTGEVDYLTESPSDYSDYIPQHPSAKAIYDIHLKMGKSKAEAAIEVLSIGLEM